MVNLKKTLRKKINKLKLIGGNKVFCIGQNKTGTTSVRKALTDLGYVIGDQAQAELLIKAYKSRNFKEIIRYCRTAEAFQDVPFSLHYTFVALDQAFPNSKFILTVRDSPEQWYDSLIKFQGKKFSGEGGLPTKEDLLNSTYRYKGYVYEAKNIYFNLTDDDLYNKDKLIDYYITHNKAIKEYFRFRPRDLLTLNLSEESAYEELCEFLNRKPLYETFPWENKT